MKKAKGGAAKEKERKKLKLHQAAQSCSQNISNMFNVVTRTTSKLESQDNTLGQPLVVLQPDNISESYDEDHQEYLIDIPGDLLIPTLAVLNSVIPGVHENEKEDLVRNTLNSFVQLPSNSLQGPSDISLAKNDKPVQPKNYFLLPMVGDFLVNTTKITNG